jgi:hypothetical protein
MAVVEPAAEPSFLSWLSALEQRQTSDLEFAEIRRALQALSGWYVERRNPAGRPRRGVAFDGRGKRAAFSLFYAPLHFLVVTRIVDALQLATDGLREIVDLGCGTGVGGAAWSLRFAEPRPRVSGTDSSGWAVGETRWNWNRLGVAGTVRKGDIARARLGGAGQGIVAAYVINELPGDSRAGLRQALLAAGQRGARVLVVEPIARRAVPWWDDWAGVFEAAGGRADTWRFPCELPEPLRALDHAAGMDHRVLTARSLCLQSSPSS